MKKILNRKTEEKEGRMKWRVRDSLRQKTGRGRPRGRRVDEGVLSDFHEHLIMEEKRAATIEKYLRDVRAFLRFAGEREVEKETVLAWKESLVEAGYAAGSLNSMLASLNSLLNYLGWTDCRVKNLKVQRQTYSPEDKELTKPEYYRLLNAAEDQPQLKLIMESICSTGIRISELQYFSVEAVRRGRIDISNKGKHRTILIPKKLQKMLLKWAKKSGIRSGAIFVTRNGNPLNRSHIWERMKKLCAAAGVKREKVFPHNLRKLFARIFYSMKKDIAKLADVLGHSSIETTRLYIMTTCDEHRKILDQMRLVTRDRPKRKKRDAVPG